MADDYDSDDNTPPEITDPPLSPAMLDVLYNNLSTNDKAVLMLKYNTSNSINQFTDNLEDRLHKFSAIFFDQNGNRRNAPIAGGKKRKSNKKSKSKRKSNKKRKSKRKSSKRR